MSPVDTLRTAITDRCNLRCIYCMPAEGIQVKPNKEILSFEEIERVVRAAVKNGVRKVRLTGGEPLMRRNIERLVGMLAAIPGLQDLAMTTNGLLLSKEKAKILRQAGLDRVTVSLDTLDPARYAEITRNGGSLDQALAGIDAAGEAGLSPVKINVVAIRDVNHNEAVGFAKFAAEHDIEVRFIELMPVAATNGTLCCNRKGEAFISYVELKKQIEDRIGRLDPVKNRSGGPAQLFLLPGGQGRVGFISAVTEPFCRGCTRMRLTADGKLRGCLFSASEIDVMSILRAGETDKAVERAFQQAVSIKPKRLAPEFSDNQRWMAQIGG